jgi:hypothetical protein
VHHQVLVKILDRRADLEKEANAAGKIELAIVAEASGDPSTYSIT